MRGIPPRHPDISRIKDPIAFTILQYPVKDPMAFFAQHAVEEGMTQREAKVRVRTAPAGSPGKIANIVASETSVELTY